MHHTRLLPYRPGGGDDPVCQASLKHVAKMVDVKDICAGVGLVKEPRALLTVLVNSNSDFDRPLTLLLQACPHKK